ncbi:MAG: hypothetical protein AB7D51_14370 [Desulfovibrionaceae bacterium]
MKKTNQAIVSQHFVQILRLSDDKNMHFVMVEREILSTPPEYRIKCSPKWHFEIKGNQSWKTKIDDESFDLTLSVGKKQSRAAFSKFLIIQDEFRGLGLGTYMMVLLRNTATSLTNSPIIVDGISSYSGDMAEKRNQFYRNLGFEVAIKNEKKDAHVGIADLRNMTSNYDAEKICEVDMAHFFEITRNISLDLRSACSCYWSKLSRVGSMSLWGLLREVGSLLRTSQRQN